MFDSTSLRATSILHPARFATAWVLGLFALAGAVACRSPSPPDPAARVESVTEEDERGPYRGYVARACGFDLDDDGVVGERDDDCRICDGRTADPDGDGVDEDLIYVDCDAGADTPDCGAPGSPCRTLDHAWGARADGADDGAEDIVCFTGTCRPERLAPAVGGVEGARRVEPTGSRSLAFEYPTNPTMLVGWDVDGDHDYPPHDPDDPALLDGAGLGRAFVLGAKNSRLEMAHFRVRDYGRSSDDARSGFVSFHERGALRADHFYLHDLAISGINQDQPTQGFRIVFDFFTGGTAFHHVAFENLELLDLSGFMVRGSGPYFPPSEAAGGDDGPYRFESLTVTAHGCDHSDEACRAGGGSAFLGWKLWGYITGVEILDSLFDANVDAWEPKPNGNGGALLVYATQCSRGWTVRGNRVLDFKVGFRAEGGDGPYCGYDALHGGGQVPRRTGDVTFEDNVFWNTYEPWRLGDVAVELRGGSDVDRSLDDVVVRGNVLASTDGFDACVRVDVGHGEAPEGVEPPTPPGSLDDPTPGTITIESNVCWGARSQGRSLGLVFGSHRPWPYRQDDVVLEGNVVAGLGEGDLAIRFLDVPANLRGGGNVFPPAARYVVGGDVGGVDDRRWAEDLETLEEILDEILGRPGDAGSLGKECVPAFVDPLAGDFALLPSDSCVEVRSAEPN